MKLKTTRSQLEGLELIIRVMLQTNIPNDPAEKLIYDIVYKAYCRIRTRVERIASTKHGWSFKLADQEALAMHVFISNATVPPIGYDYEKMQLQSMFTNIHDEYGQPVYRNQSYSMLATGSPQC